MYPVTSLDMYNLTLEILNKAKTSSVTPEEWNPIANSLQIEYVLSIAKTEEDQSVIDRLNPIINDVDIPNTGGNVAGQESFILPSDYLRLRSVGFRLNYVNDDCFSDGPGSEVLSAQRVTDDEKSIIDENPYRRAQTNRLRYFQSAGNILKVFTGNASYGISAKVRYLRYPKTIDVTQSPGVGDCEMPTDFKNDLCHLIAKRFIEIQESGRYLTVQNEVKEIINN